MYNTDLLIYIGNECERQSYSVIAGNFRSELEPLLENELIELDPAGADAQGNIKVALTDFGVKTVQALGDRRTPEPEPEPTQTEAPAGAHPLAPQPIPEAPQVPVWAQPTGRLHVATADPNIAAALEVQPEPELVPEPTPTPPWAQQTNDAVPQTPVPAPTPAATGVQVISGLTPPMKRTRQRRAKPIDRFPFDTMEVNTAFYVPPSEEFPNPTKDFQPLVGMANRRYATEKKDEHGNVIMRESRRNRTMKDAAGNYILDSTGARMTEENVNMVPEMVYSRRFELYDAKKVPNQQMTVGAYIFRTI